MRTLSLFIYNLLLPLATLLMAPGALLKMQRRGGQWSDFFQRLGWWPTRIVAGVREMREGNRVIWMHAVSVGEVGVAKKLIQALMKADRGIAVVLTSTTPTGLELAREAERGFPGRVLAVYSPLDLPWVAAGVMRRLRPEQIVLVEAEIWPNLMAAAAAAKIPVRLVNARLSGRSERRFGYLKALIAPIFSMLDRVGIQEPGDVARWARLGVLPERIVHTGSVKYDPQGSAPKSGQVEELSAVLEGFGLGGGRPLLLAASTHPGEEKALAEVYLQLVRELPNLGFVAVPRHFERGAAVAGELRSLGLKVALRTAQAEAADVLVVDSTGELRAWQALASLVVIGKSFLSHGGQNPAEAVMAGRPVICGPNMENFIPVMKLLLSAKGAIQVADLGGVVEAAAHLLADPAAASALAERGRHALRQHEGATQRTVAMLVGSTLKE